VANDIPGVPAPTDNNVGTPGGVPGLNLDKEICANVTPNVAGDSRFAQYYLKYGNNFNKASCHMLCLGKPVCAAAQRVPHQLMHETFCQYGTHRIAPHRTALQAMALVF
jgi:hypothetical protein